MKRSIAFKAQRKFIWFFQKLKNCSLFIAIRFQIYCPTQLAAFMYFFIKISFISLTSNKWYFNLRGFSNCTFVDKMLSKKNSFEDKLNIKKFQLRSISFYTEEAGNFSVSYSPTCSKRQSIWGFQFQRCREQS